MRRRQGEKTNHQADVRAVELQLDLDTIEVCVVENIKDNYMLTKY